MLRRILWSIIVNSLALWVTSLIVRGLQFTGTGAIIITALILGVINAIIKPILNFISLPLTILTLGIFIFVVNAICLEIVASLSPGFSIASFWSAIIGAIVLSIFTTIFNWLLFPKEVRR